MGKELTLKRKGNKKLREYAMRNRFIGVCKKRTKYIEYLHAP
jgi:hypothetical protein